EFDIAELSLCTHLLTTARGSSHYVAVPAFVSRAFRHSSIYIRSDDGIDRPEALSGRRIGVPDFQQTAGVWARGMLADEYGLRRGDVHWRMGGLEQAGREARVPLELKNGLQVEPIAGSQTLSAMLAAGELDAVISPRAPSCWNNGAKVGRLFPGYRQAEEAYYRKTRLFPLMHVIGIRRSLVDQHPWLPANVYAHFLKRRAVPLGELRRMYRP